MPSDENAAANASGNYRSQGGDLGMLGLRDAEIAGWFLNDAAEMFRGFPITRDDVVIDVGCGDGSPAAFCARRGAELILTDIDEAQVGRAEQRCREAGALRITTHVGNSINLPIENAVGSRIICSEVLEHVENPVGVLSELVRVGKPGALYLLTVPDPVGEEMQRHLAPPTYFLPPNHLRVFSREAFGELVEAAGLRIEQRHFYGFFWSMWWLLFWAADVPLERPEHPVLDAWAATWSALLDTNDGPKVKRVFDRLMPKSQLVLARKPL